MAKDAYFRMADASEAKEPFVVKLVDPGTIAHARRIISGDEKNVVHVSGKIVKERAGYNPAWSFHIDPASVEFFENAIEVCDATMVFVERNLDSVGGSTLPGSHWCPWTSKVIEEIRPPSGAI